MKERLYLMPLFDFVDVSSTYVSRELEQLVNQDSRFSFFFNFLYDQTRGS